MELAPGIHRIGDDRVAFLLVVGDDGVTLVDAGLPGHRRDLRHELTRLGLTERDVRGVILTHGDSDHIGFAEALRAEHGVPVFVHEADAARTRGDEKPPATRTPSWRPVAALQFLGTALAKGGRTRHVRTVHTVVDGDELALPGSPRVVGLPGHSPGSIAVVVQSSGGVGTVVAVGDALTTRHVLTGEERPGPAPFTDDEEQADRSLDTLASIDAQIVVPGHGTVWRGSPRELVAAVRAHPAR